MTPIMGYCKTQKNGHPESDLMHTRCINVAGDKIENPLQVLDH